MLQSNEHWLSVADAFYDAALDGQGWGRALEGLAEATGSSVGELIGLGSNAAVPFNILTNAKPGFEKEFVASGGGDPRINPRVNAGMNAPVLKVLAESDFITPEEYKRHPHYQEFALPWEVPFICLTTLERQNGMLIGLAVARNQRQGHITSQQREVFTSLAPHVRAAVRMQMALEGQGANLLVGAMEALSIPAFVCDSSGRVQALTPAAEQLVSLGRGGLQLRQGHLQATDAGDAKTLNDAIAIAAIGLVEPGPPIQRTVVIRGDEGKVPSVVLDVIALPSPTLEFSFTPRVLIVARGERHADGRRAAILQTVYALTAAETDVALQIAKGRTAEAIAAERGATVGTVRVQIKAILAKLGVSRQIEVAARLSDL
ncbi:MAG TPA: helix-turn-helix transcriptional regulator [Gammaproteobacteria bacterium]